MSKTVTILDEFKINYLTQAQYDAEVAGGTVQPDELYLTLDSSASATQTLTNKTIDKALNTVLDNAINISTDTVLTSSNYSRDVRYNLTGNGITLTLPNIANVSEGISIKKVVSTGSNVNYVKYYLADGTFNTETLSAYSSATFKSCYDTTNGLYWVKDVVYNYDGGTDFQRVDFSGSYEATLASGTSRNITAPYDGLLVLRVYYHLYGAVFSIKINNNTVFLYNHPSAEMGQTAGPRNDVYFQFRVKKDDIITIERSDLDPNTNYNIALEAQFSRII